MSGEVLALQRIAKRYGRLSVLRQVDLVLQSGEIVGLIGANGAGKTTLLSIVAGLVQPSAGHRSFWGQEAQDIDAAIRARMAVVTHTAQVYARLTALENLQLFASLRQASGLPTAACEPLLERLGLGHAQARLAGTFSRGMAQRLALARALVGKPELLLLDEPFTALDRPGRALLTEVLRDEQDKGTSILASSHDFEAIAGATDRVVLLEAGAIAGEVERRADEATYRDDLHQLLSRMPARPHAPEELARA